MQRSKESRARVVVFKQLGILNSLTMEASFAGAIFDRHAGVHFTPAMLMQMGQYFCDTILDYFDPDQSRLRAVYDEPLALYPPGTELSGGGEDSAGSDDNPSEDCADPAELEQQQARRKKEKKEKKGGDAKSKTFKAGAAKRKERRRRRRSRSRRRRAGARLGANEGAAAGGAPPRLRHRRAGGRHAALSVRRRGRPRAE